MSDKVRCIWVRHFPVSERGLYVGQCDVDAILPAAHTPLAWNPDMEDAVWITSPLRRAVQTAQWLRPMVQWSVAPELMEQSFGQWEGKRYEDISLATDAPETLRPPEGESFLRVVERVQHWIDQALKNHAGKTLVIVCHAGVIRAALAHALGVSPGAALAFQPTCGSVTEVVYSAIEGRIYAQVKSVGVPLIISAKGECTV